MTQRRVTCVSAWCVLLSLTLGAAAARGQTGAAWLLPERFVITPGATLAFEVAQGDEFAAEPKPVPPGNIAAINGRLDGAPIFLTGASLAANATRFSGTFPRPGRATIVVDLRLEPVTIPADEVEAYLRKLHIADNLLDAWRASGAEAWRERRGVRLKTSVLVGVAQAAASEEPLDTGLDVVVEQAAAPWHAGDRLSVRVFAEGKPQAGAMVTFLANGGTREHVVVSDGAGRAAVQLDASGLWQIHWTRVSPARDAVSQSATETVAVTVDVR